MLVMSGSSGRHSGRRPETRRMVMRRLLPYYIVVGCRSAGATSIVITVV